ncbi:MAG TPA: NAD-glutamate dehydrogenase domain-containing protein, partial [Pseudolabrys sp.]|nr:NAD-glutamate dehydrogenase domain-containing protein [Pseudolabrys sp.]
MAVPANLEESAARATIEKASASLARRRAEIPASLIEQLYGRSVPEDVVRYGPDDLAMLAARAYDFMAERTPGTPKIRCETIKLAHSADRNSVTVVEIVNDDMPFLVDSVMGEIAERKPEVRLVAHPVFGVRRSGTKLSAINAPLDPGPRESLIHIHLAPIADGACDETVRALQTVLGEVRLAVQDWRDMRARVDAVIAELKANPPPMPVDEIAEAIQFLQWLLADNFTFLGVRDYNIDGQLLQPDFDSALGIMRSRELRVLKRGTELLEFTPEIMAFLKEPRPLIIAKANIHSRVHRRVYLDYVGVKRFDSSGNLVGEHRIIGLFTSTAYTRGAHGIPYLRRKIAAVEERAGFNPASHSGKALANVLEHYPRDELFQVDEDTLYRFALAILQLDERPRVRVLARRDRFDRFVSVLVYVPRERYDSHIRAKIGAYLADIFIGRVSAFYPFFPDEGSLVRVHFIIGRSGGPAPEIERATLEREVESIIRTWSDGLSEALELVNPPEKARELFTRYRDAFSEGFHEAYAPSVAAGDIRLVEGLSEQRALAVDFHHRMEEDQQSVGLKVWTYARPLPLSERVPVLENMGFRVVDEHTYQIEGKDRAGVWFHDMLLTRADGGAIDLDTGGVQLETAFLMIMRGGAENDGYNALTLHGGLAWRDVALIRTLSRFLRQIRVPYSQDYMWATLVKHSGIAAGIVELFHARFDPRAESGPAEKQNAIAARLEEGLQKVESLDEDRILRHFINAVQSAIRTNFYQTDEDGQPKPLI